MILFAPAIYDTIDILWRENKVILGDYERLARYMKWNAIKWNVYPNTRICNSSSSYTSQNTDGRYRNAKNANISSYSYSCIKFKLSIHRYWCCRLWQCTILNLDPSACAPNLLDVQILIIAQFQVILWGCCVASSCLVLVFSLCSVWLLVLSGSVWLGLFSLVVCTWPGLPSMAWAHQQLVTASSPPGDTADETPQSRDTSQCEINKACLENFFNKFLCNHYNDEVVEVVGVVEVVEVVCLVRL